MLIVGGPGCGRGQQCKRLTDRYIGWVHIRVGDLLRHEFNNSQDTKWPSIVSLVNNGDLAPPVWNICSVYNIIPVAGYVLVQFWIIIMVKTNLVHVVCISSFICH